MTTYDLESIRKAMYQPKTLDDWYARVGGAGPNQAAAYAGNSIVRKDITTSPPADAFVAGDFFTNTFGAKVWDSLNSQTRFFNLIRKVAWGPTTGYRIRSGRNLSTRPVTEVGALPDIDSPDLQTVYIQPKFIVTSLATSALAQFLGTLEGGIGDALAVAQETAMIDHTKRLNQMLLAGAYQRAAVDNGSGSFDAIDGSWFNIGDTFIDSGGSGTGTVTGVSGNTVTFSGGDFVAADEVVVVQSRAGFHSIDNIVSRTLIDTGDVALSNAQAPGYGSLVSADRDANAWSASYVSVNAGVLRHLSTGLVDAGIDSVRRNGGEPDLIVTGIEQVTRLGTVLQANQHFIGEGTFQVKMGGEGTLKGYPTGFQVATYKGIPVFHDFDTSTSWQLAANGDAKRGSNVYVLDTRYLEIPVLYTTQYMESRDFLQNNMLGVKAIYVTAADFRALDFVKQAKIGDLSDGTNLT